MMEDQALETNSRQSTRTRQAACLNCRKSKIRCNRTQGEERCDRCSQSHLECVVPNHHVGRQKGVKNKRKGLEKALHQIEQATKRPKTDPSTAEAAQRLIANLQDLLSDSHSHRSPNEKDDLALSSPSSPQTSPVLLPRDTISGESLALDDAENPLQLLARASDLQLSPNDIRDAPVAAPPNLAAGASVSVETNVAPAKNFFVPVRANLDIGSDMDPIEIGLVSLQEAESLFSFFYQKLAHTRWGLDPFIHTVEFVRSQSAFLFTSIMAAAALFMPAAAALSKRLSRHSKLLANEVIKRRLRSAEIVLAFMVNVPWMAPGSCLGDDDACSYIAMALSIALDLSLNKIVMPSTSFDSSLPKRLAKAECIDARRALHIDGFDHVDPTFDWGRRLLRRRERIWIALFVLERGVCLARGRNYTVPLTALIENCDRWHIAELADSRDGAMNSMAVLRRNLDGLFSRVKASCDNYQTNSTGSGAAHSIKSMIESFYDEWYESWTPAIGEGQSRALPPYVEILVTHTMLSTYGGVINHPTASVEVKRFFRAAGLSSALNVMRAAIQGEARLKSMPNNTVIMISFAACSALSLSVMPTDSKSSLAPSVRHLIEEAAGVLERIGATPSHRDGASVLYGRFLRELIRRTPAGLNPQAQIEPRVIPHPEALPPATLGNFGSIPTTTQETFAPSLFWSEPLQFSAMSDDQIIDAVNRAGTAFGASVPDVPLDDMLSWDWLDISNPEFSF
ncbi:Zn(II)2Cys6 transcription factor [Aspergillus pseudoustus]|uniref:Zn(II)2Cys6 transcription factor n=1 Tax=Aspergillus pseudoustus TaxID=1810923 RepID=A0ABR4J847_9EURO